jgi:hypothetical protein
MCCESGRQRIKVAAYYAEDAGKKVARFFEAM